MAAHRLSIGVPVYNSERYLESALSSLLAQTYSDYELIIVDNASTDRTQELCRAFAERDARVHYHRNERNLGAAANWYRALELSSGEYYKYAADDDLYEPEFVARCVSALDENPNAVACYTKTILIDDDGQNRRDLDADIDTASGSAHERLYDVIAVDYLCIQLYGVIRASALGRCGRYEGYYGWDRNMLAELCLLGGVLELPERLFLHRLHRNSAGSVLHFARTLEDLEKLDPSVNWKLELSGLNPSAFTRFANYFRAVARAPLDPTEKARCGGQILRAIAKKSGARLKRVLARPSNT